MYSTFEVLTAAACPLTTVGDNGARTPMARVGIDRGTGAPAVMGLGKVSARAFRPWRSPV